MRPEGEMSTATNPEFILAKAMDQVEPPRSQPSALWASRRVWEVASTALVVLSLVLFIGVLVSNLQALRNSIALLAGMTAAFCIFSLLLAKVLLQLRRDQRNSASVLQMAAHEFQQMAGNIQEIFWMIDAASKRALYVNQAYETITGCSCQSLLENPLSYRDLIHPDDRLQILGKLEEAARKGEFNERFRIVRPSGEVRWVWARGFPVRDSDGKIRQLVGTVLEITAQREAEEQVATNLALAQSSGAEAEALRKATFGLTQDLRMDFVLEALLQSLADLIPYSCARVLIAEGGPHVLSLGEKLHPHTPNPGFPLTLNADDSPFLQRILDGQNSVLISDTREEQSWQSFEGHDYLRSWLSAPLIASGQYLGFLSVGHVEPNRFTQDHLRRAELLAIPAAAAIQNSRLYERAAIYGEELEKRIEDLRRAQAALAQSEEGHRLSEDRFQKVFRSSPVPFSITTAADGQFVDVNAAFECRYGYSRAELLGRRTHELRIWEELSDHALLVGQVQRGPVRNVVIRLRTKSGQIKTATYSADRIQFDGQACILAVSDELPDAERDPSN
jgi:PAS domain S-box-containing protein